MHVAIDLTGLLPQPTGVDVYMKELILHLTRIDRQNQYTLLLNRTDRTVPAARLPANFSAVHIRLRPKLARAGSQLLIPPLARLRRFDVIHSPAFLVPLLSSAPRHLLTVHDMTFFQMPEVHNRLHRSRAFLWAVRRSIRLADLISVPSQATRTALLAEMPDLEACRIRVVSFGIDDRFSPAEPDEIRIAMQRMGLAFPYILCVGTLEPRKNLPLLLAGYRRLIASGDVPEHLVLAGKSGWGMEQIERELSAEDLSGRVHRLGYVAGDDLPWLYRGARLFVYPSLQEGFGFPPLEAMACGVPTIVANNSSLKENLSGAAELVPAHDPEALASALRTLLCSEALRQQRRQLGIARASEFGWHRTAATTLEMYRELAQA